MHGGGVRGEALYRGCQAVSPLHVHVAPWPATACQL